MLYVGHAPYKCENTGLTYYEINGEVFVRRDDLVDKLIIPFWEEDKLKKVGENKNDKPVGWKPIESEDDKPINDVTIS